MDTSVIKLGISLIASFSAGRVIGQVIKNNTVREKTIDKIAFPIGTYVLGAMIGAQVTKHVEAKIDQIAEAMKPKSEVILED